ncbi:MAG: hypothetical protein ACYTE8_09245 [Planctomycetota bacterium]|jgi:hypothetical protein
MAKKLTARQLSAIPTIVSNPTYTQGAEKACISRRTFYRWLEIPKFRDELNHQRKAIAEEALGMLEQSLTKAVEVLVALLDTQDERLKRLFCNDIIEHILKNKENKELEERLVAIEQALDKRV